MVISMCIAYVSMLTLLVILSVMLKQKIVFIAIGVVFVGVLGNSLVVKANGGKMPVFIKNMSVYAKADLSVAPRHQVGTVNTKYAYLADFITINKTQSTYSPGDISMTLGPVLLAISILWQIIYTLRYEGFGGFLYNNQPISYTMSIMTIYAVFLGCRHILLYA